MTASEQPDDLPFEQSQNVGAQFDLLLVGGELAPCSLLLARGVPPSFLERLQQIN
jgi:hypothetical protein